jgi:uncharacterized protein
MPTEKKSKRTPTGKSVPVRGVAKKRAPARAGAVASARSVPKPAKPAPKPTARSAAKAPPPRTKAPHKTAQDAQQERMQLILQEKAELQEVVRQMRAERDSALAETTRMEERIRELEVEQSRRSTQEPRPAGPGGFDPAVDLEEDAGAMGDDDLEGAAGFFDRIDELRARRVELDRERADRELEQSDQSFWMICPKCGDLMEEQEAENIKLERCETCGGLYLDRGEADLLISLTAEKEGLRRLHHVLKF